MIRDEERYKTTYVQLKKEDKKGKELGGTDKV